MSAFDLFYETFVQNQLRHDAYLLTLQDGSQLTGIPYSSTTADASDLGETGFSVKTSAGAVRRFKFRDLASARLV